MIVSKKYTKDLYNNTSEDFVPAACHYDASTLLTKNGELLQIIQINGIHSEEISQNLVNLRQVVRSSIRHNVECKKFAFWIHTIRRKEDLDDKLEYDRLLSANIHDIWCRKNYWHDKFVNRLYITIVHRSANLKLKNFNSWVNSLSAKIISNSEEKFLSQAAEELNNTVNSILEGLNAYGAEKLSIRIEGEDCYSDPMFLYRRIMQLNEESCPVPVSDISSALASHQYAVGVDKIEVIGKDGKKFAALLSIKEYKEVSAEALDKFLQIPVEMIATEVFYFVEREEVVNDFEDQAYILEVSGDSELNEFKGLHIIMSKVKDEVRFCHHQISFMVIGDDIKILEKQVHQASNALSKIGILHVREDINLEKTFWAQLPGNFSFLARMKPTILRQTAALASLHHFPTGHQYSKWGQAITLLRTEKGTPYFANFHDNKNLGTTCIFGEKKSGKTILLNFLLSEADKYNPITIYLTDDTDSSLYIEARGGKWLKTDETIINPFLCKDTEGNRKFSFEFFKIISNHYFDPLSEDELNYLQTLVDNVFKLKMEDRKLTKIIQTLDDSSKIANALKARLAVYLPGGLYHGLFESENAINLEETPLFAINLKAFDDAEYTTANYPKEKKLVEQFQYNLHSMQAVKAAIVLSAQNIMQNLNNDIPKILAIDNFSEIVNLEHYSNLFSSLSDKMTSINGVFVSTSNIDALLKLNATKTNQTWIPKINTSFILPSEVSMAGVDKLLNLDSAEFKKLTTISNSSRMFLIKQDGHSIACELSLGGFPGITRLLCSGKEEQEIYKEIIKEVGNNKPEDWVGRLYAELENIGI